MLFLVCAFQYFSNSNRNCLWSNSVRGKTVFARLNQIQIPLAIPLYIHSLVIITEVFLTGGSCFQTAKQQQNSASLPAGSQWQVISIPTLKGIVGGSNTPGSRINPVNHRNRNKEQDIDLSSAFSMGKHVKQWEWQITSVSSEQTCVSCKDKELRKNLRGMLSESTSVLLLYFINSRRLSCCMQIHVNQNVSVTFFAQLQNGIDQNCYWST